jgi:pilus assembly protein CpaB
VNSRRITLIVAVVLAIGTGVLTLSYLASFQRNNAPPPVAETKQIVVAAKDIPARSKITQDELTITKRAVDQNNPLEPGAISDPKQVDGDVALITIPAGSTITETKVGRAPDIGVTGRLKPGQRAISIPVDRVKAVSGLIQPGDRVDILASVPRGNGVQPKVVAFLRGILILAINATLENQAGASPSADQGGAAATVTFAVTPKEADILTNADLNTTLRLALRSPQEPAHSLPNEDLVFNDTSAPAAAPVAPVYPIPVPANPAPAPTVGPKAPAFPSVPQGGGVTIIDGDKITMSNPQ